MFTRNHAKYVYTRFQSFLGIHILYISLEQTSLYIKGISCPNCFGKISESKKKSLIDRNKQISVAKKKGLYSPYIKQTVNEL